MHIAMPTRDLSVGAVFNWRFRRLDTWDSIALLSISSPTSIFVVGQVGLGHNATAPLQQTLQDRQHSLWDV